MASGLIKNRVPVPVWNLMVFIVCIPVALLSSHQHCPLSPTYSILSFL
jgi:hypothetical protein